MTGDLRECCTQAGLDGLTPAEHYESCTARADDPPEDQGALFDLNPQPTRGGQHL